MEHLAFRLNSKAIQFYAWGSKKLNAHICAKSVRYYCLDVPPVSASDRLRPALITSASRYRTKRSKWLCWLVKCVRTYLLHYEWGNKEMMNRYKLKDSVFFLCKVFFDGDPTVKGNRRTGQARARTFCRVSHSQTRLDLCVGDVTWPWVFAECRRLSLSAYREHRKVASLSWRVRCVLLSCAQLCVVEVTQIQASFPARQFGEGETALRLSAPNLGRLVERRRVSWSW